jgi:hypothetical protein
VNRESRSVDGDLTRSARNRRSRPCDHHGMNKNQRGPATQTGVTQPVQAGILFKSNCECNLQAPWISPRLTLRGQACSRAVDADPDLRGTTRAWLSRRLRCRARITPSDGPSSIGKRRSLCPAELSSGRGLPVRREPRGRAAERRDADREGRLRALSHRMLFARLEPAARSLVPVTAVSFLGVFHQFCRTCGA